MIDLRISKNGYSSETYQLIDQGDHNYMELGRLLSASKADGTFLQWKDGRYQWVTIQQLFGLYKETLK